MSEDDWSWEEQFADWEYEERVQEQIKEEEKDGH